MARYTVSKPARSKPILTTKTADEGFLTGQLLIAMPTMTEPPFGGSVIFLCAHSPEGAMGIIINQPLEQPSFEDLLQQLDIEPIPPARRITLCSGGPVEAARGFVLHSADWSGDGSLPVDEDITLTASRDILKAIAEGGGPRDSVLALGYAGWGAGQLDREFQENSWLSAPANRDLLFSPEHDTKWRRALASLHIDPLLLSGAAGHA